MYVEHLNQVAQLKARHYKPRPSTYTIVHGQNLLSPRPELGEESDLWISRVVYMYINIVINNMNEKYVPVLSNSNIIITQYIANPLVSVGSVQSSVGRSWILAAHWFLLTTVHAYREIELPIL